MRFLKVSAFVSLLLASSLGPAAAQDWGATSSPATAQNGMRYCMIWTGEQMPMMNITAVAGQQESVVQATGLSTAAGASSGSFVFDNGRSLALTQIALPAPTAAVIPLSAEDVSRLLSEIALGGGITLRIGGANVRFPIEGAASEAASMQSCMGQL